MSTEIQTQLFKKIQEIETQFNQREARLIALLEQQSVQQQKLAEQHENLAMQLNTLQQLLLSEYE